MNEAISPAIELFVGLLLLAIVVAIAVRPLRLPYTVALVVAGLLVGIGANAAGRSHDRCPTGARPPCPSAGPRLRGRLPDAGGGASPLVRRSRAAGGAGGRRLGRRRRGDTPFRDRFAARPRFHRRRHALGDGSGRRGRDIQAAARPRRPRDHGRRREPPQRRNGARPLRDRRGSRLRATESGRGGRVLRRDGGHQRCDRPRHRISWRPGS